MSINIPGLIAVIVFYLLILVIGIIAGRKTAKTNTSDELFLANRSLGMGVAMFTLAASLVGGAYINGTAQMVAFSGLLWAQAPVGYCIGLFIGGLFYAPKMRRGNYITMFDPFQARYGKVVASLLFFPQLLGDLFWTAAILSALGATIAIILGLDGTLSIIVSACVVISYTVLGGLYAVAYTDVIQLICIVFGLVLAFPFAVNHPAVDLSRISDTWLGVVHSYQIPLWVDLMLLLVFGGIPWQTYFQRVLACRTPEIAQRATMVSSIFCLVMAIPPAIMGAVGAAVDWNATSYAGEVPIPPSQQSFILPIVLNNICPLPVGIIGIGAVSAAVMSSADSCVLSTGSVFTKNIYHDIIRKKATERELVWVLRISIVVVGCIASVVAIMVQSVYGLFTLCSDLMYVILFPQLTCILWVPVVNTYGCLSGYLVSFILRIGGGEPLLGLPALIRFPFYDEDSQTQLFPFRTFVTLISFAAIIGVSALASTVFKRGWLPLKYDVLKVMKRKHEQRESVKNTCKHSEINQQDKEDKRGECDTDYEMQPPPYSYS